MAVVLNLAPISSTLPSVRHVGHGGAARLLYKMRHLVENAVLHLKGWRGIATRCAKRASSYRAIVQIRCLILWANISRRHYLNRN